MPELAKRRNSGFVTAAHHKKSPAEAGLEFLGKRSGTTAAAR
jgi:hypothetical protein